MLKIGYRFYLNTMNRAQKYIDSLPTGSYLIDIVEREWGVEKMFKCPDGNVHCIPERILLSDIENIY